MTNADKALEAASALGLSKSDFAELALLALDQAGASTGALQGALDLAAPFLTPESAAQWRKEAHRWPR